MVALQAFVLLVTIGLGLAWNQPNTCIIRSSALDESRLELLENNIKQLEELLSNTPAPPTVGGGLYTRWGSKTCPNITDTEIVYTGIAATSSFSEPGGGANYLCLPEDPEYTLPS